MINLFKKSQWLSPEEYSHAVSALPLVSVDLVVVNPARQVLMGFRRNAPAQQWWFTPGGSVRKHEPFLQAIERVGRWELGLSAINLQGARCMGIWDHFYEDSAFSAEVSTHYVNLPHVLYLANPPDLVSLPIDQHSEWRWQDAYLAAVADDVHPYARAYAEWVAENKLGSALHD